MTKKNTTANITAKAEKMLQKATETAQKDSKAKQTAKTEKTAKTETAKQTEKTAKQKDKKVKVYKDATINLDKISADDKKKVTADKKELDTLKTDRQNVTINIDYKKQKFTVKQENTLIARINKRKKDYYLRVYDKAHKETIYKNQTLADCIKTINKRLAK